MKTIKILPILMLLLYLIVSCSKENTENKTFQVNIGDAKAFIETEIRGITYKFQLLNEAGNPATEFNEGENFTFYFSETNNTKTDLHSFKQEMPVVSEHFFHIFTSSDKNKGVPFVCTNLASKELSRLPIYAKKSRVIQQSWLHNSADNTWSIHSKYGGIAFKNLKTESLKKGNYYTKIKHNFIYRELGNDQNRFTIEDVYFKINFKIK